VAALVIVFIFLVGYYYLSGFVAFIAVVMNLILIIGCMAAINATFTLPGIAGIVLSVAMAVDANVLIFERLREEQARGLSLKMALRNAYDRAFSAIIDGQLTTAISSAFLFWFGSEEVRGFGLTLLIGIVTSLFTSLYVTRAIFDIMVDKFGVKDLSSLPRTFPGWNRMLTPRVDWVKLAWPAAIFSTIFIGAGLLAFGVKLSQGQALDIEFSGGTSVRVELRDGLNLDRAQLQDAVDAVTEQRPGDLAAARVVSLQGGRLFEISTPTTSATAVQKAVVEGLGDKLKIAQPSRFDGLESDYEQALNQTVFPIEDVRTRVEGVPPYLTQGHVGGVAIVLNQLSPALDAKTIKERIDQRKDTESSDSRPERVEVQTFDNNTRAVVVISDPRYTYNTASATALQQWQTSLAGPAWQIVKDAVNNPPQLKGVTSFNAQVAGEAKSNTAMAMALSILGIMAYIWMRFGNLKFGFATVVACVHDGLFVVAGIGFSYYLGQIGFFENVLLIKPFRIDLTLVAAILTVVGYSMNDTVVVFDRIRENRGKFGVLSRQVINDSINQTFSRTLLTGGTSIGILSVMYVIGGDGIHAFTFAMLLGIVVGTYSSVLIAAPLLLVGKDIPQATRAPARAMPA
jgi:SecD/SecF fusion protein